jgi:hypothetical protein
MRRERSRGDAMSRTRPSLQATPFVVVSRKEAHSFAVMRLLKMVGPVRLEDHSEKGGNDAS